MIFSSAATRHEGKGSWPYSWHRDNPCRIFGKGADWNEEIYNCIGSWCLSEIIR